MRGEMLGPIGTPAYKIYLDDINSSGQHLLRIINDILDLSRIEAGKRELREALSSLGEIAREGCSLLDLKARQKGITVTEVIEDNLPKIVLDEQAIRQSC
jgi:two-component system cell cycle sensor histidine kinase PleC